MAPTFEWQTEEKGPEIGEAYLHEGRFVLEKRAEDDIDKAFAADYGGKKRAEVSGLFSQRDVDRVFNKLKRVIETYLDRNIQDDPTSEKKRKATNEIIDVYKRAWLDYKRKYKIQLKK